MQAVGNGQGGMPAPTGSSTWADALNARPGLRESLGSWTCALILSFIDDTRGGEWQLFLGLEQGVCQAARVATPDDLLAATYILATNSAVWRSLLRREINVTRALTERRLELRRGDVGGLIVHVRALQALVEAIPDALDSSKNVAPRVAVAPTSTPQVPLAPAPAPSLVPPAQPSMSAGVGSSLIAPRVAPGTTAPGQTTMIRPTTPNPLFAAPAAQAAAPSEPVYGHVPDAATPPAARAKGAGPIYGPIPDTTAASTAAPALPAGPVYGSIPSAPVQVPVAGPAASTIRPAQPAFRVVPPMPARGVGPIYGPIPEPGSIPASVQAAPTFAGPHDGTSTGAGVVSSAPAVVNPLMARGAVPVNPMFAPPAPPANPPSYASAPPVPPNPMFSAPASPAPSNPMFTQAVPQATVPLVPSNPMFASQASQVPSNPMFTPPASQAYVVAPQVSSNPMFATPAPGASVPSYAAVPQTQGNPMFAQPVPQVPQAVAPSYAAVPQAPSNPMFARQGQGALDMTMVMPAAGGQMAQFADGGTTAMQPVMPGYYEGAYGSASMQGATMVQPAVMQPTAADIHRAGMSTRFWLWRHTRPFQGALLMTIAGLLTLAAPAFLIQFAAIPGSQLYAALLVGGLLVGMGLITMFSPEFAPITRTIGIVLSLTTLIVAVGGLVIGIALGLQGSALAIAWKPNAKPAPPKIQQRINKARARANGAAR